MFFVEFCSGLLDPREAQSTIDFIEYYESTTDVYALHILFC